MASETVSLRWYQQEAIDAIQQDWKAGLERVLLNLATGTGKTVVFSSLIKKLKEDNPSARFLILAHRKELTSQSVKTIERITGIFAELEQGKNRASSEPDILVASVQSISRDSRLKKYSPEYFDYIIIDEAHHSGARTYKKVIEYFSPAKVLGVTATPYRSGDDELKKVYQKISFSYTLRQAIKEGYLSRIVCKSLPVKIDLSKVKRKKTGDFKEADLSKAVEPHFREVAALLREVCPDRKIVVFLPRVEDAQRFSMLLEEEGFHSCEINGTTDPEIRDQRLADFNDGKLNVICNVGILTEGWDCPAVDCVVILRPTESSSLYSQMIGRGTRLSDGKDHMLLLDFLWQTGKHQKDLADPSSLFYSDPEERNVCRELLKKGGEVDLLKSEKEIEEEIQQIRKSVNDLLAEQAHREAEEYVLFGSRKEDLPKGLHTFSKVLGIELENMDLKTPFSWQRTSITERQKAVLEKCKGLNLEGFNFQQASACIGILKERTSRGLSTYNQCRTLKRFRYSDCPSWSFQQASQILNELAANNWKRVNSYG